MNITAIESFPFGTGPDRLDVVRLAAGDRYGLGSAGCSTRGTDLANLLRQVTPRVVGQDAFDVEAMRTAAQMDEALKGAGPALLAGIEMAMLDLTSKALGVPLHQMLGGRVRDRVRALATDWADPSGSIDEQVTAARRAIGLGFDALKVQPFAADAKEPHLERGIALVAALRQALPSWVDLVVDGQARLSLADARAFSIALGALEPLWFGDPVAASPELARLSVESNVPLAVGGLATPAELRNVVSAQSADYLLLDVSALGGLLECRRIASWAEVFHIGAVPIDPAGPIDLAVSLQIAASVSTCTIVELPVGLLAASRGVGLSLGLEQGQLEIGNAPGLGISPIDR